MRVYLINAVVFLGFSLPNRKLRWKICRFSSCVGELILVSSKTQSRKNRRCAETDTWSLTVLYFWGRLVGTRYRITCRERGSQLAHRSTRFYLNGIFQDACLDSCARTIRATTYATIFARFTSKDRDALAETRGLLHGIGAR